MKKITITLMIALVAICNAMAVDFKVALNTSTRCMTLLDASQNVVEPADIANPNTSSTKYSYAGVAPGKYTIEGMSAEGGVVTGKLALNVTEESQDVTYEVCTAITGISNSGWTMGTDWTVKDLTVTDANGNAVEAVYGASTQANRVSIILFRGNTYTLNFNLSEERLSQNYDPAVATATVSSGSTSSSVTCAQYGYYTVTVDENVSLSLGYKTRSEKAANGGTHFIPLNNMPATVTPLEDGKKQLQFKLYDGYYYIYNASMPGKRSMKGYFCFYANPTGTKVVPQLNLTADDFGTTSPTWMNHDATSNGGSNVADIRVNINEKGYLNMAMGEERDVVGIRDWQLINSSIGNYYVEPDYHYTVINEKGEKDNSVVTFDSYSTTWNPWVRMKAVGKGTAIVLVTYDACKTTIHSANGTTSNFYSNTTDGEWSALWPENTGVYVVTVGQADSKVTTNMKNLEGMNVITSGANAGKPTRYAAENVDAELDVFYFTEGEGYTYSFTPENAAKVEVAYPVIGETMTTYNGFGTEGVSVADGTYSVLLKEGTNIVRLTDADGNATYQVLRAKKAQYELVNETRPGMTPQAGDKVKVQYNGLYHPCNKLSGIYNMSGAIVYQGTANDNSIVGGSNQYAFGGTPAAQAFSITIPSDVDAEATPYYNIGSGMLRVSGFGSAYGAHRYFTRETGATPNTTAVVGTSYFGQLPEIQIPLMVAKKYGVKFDVTPAEAVAEITVVNAEGKTIAPDAEGYYNGIFGKYAYTIVADGYKRMVNVPFAYEETTPEQQTFSVTLAALSAKDWDGKTLSEPQKDAEGYYLVGTGAELAWIANDVKNGNYDDNFIITDDFSLGNFDWTPIGGTSSKQAFTGECKGNGHVITDLYVNTTSNYAGLFGYVKGNISGITVYGSVTTTGNYAGGIAGGLEGTGYADESQWRTISDCVNHANITAKEYAGGIAGTVTTSGQLKDVYNDGDITATTTTISRGYAGGIVGNGNGWYTRIYNAYNLGNVTAMAYVGGIAGSYGSGSQTALENAYNLGTLTATSTNAAYVKYCGSIVGGNTSSYPAIKNAYTATAHTADNNATLVDAADFTSGKVAYLLGDAFGQQIGVDASPVLRGMKVYTDGESYYNKTKNTIAAGSYIVVADIEANDGYTIPDALQKYVAEGYQAAARFAGDENLLTISSTEGLLNGFTVVADNVEYSPAKTFTLEGKTFNICSLAGTKTTGTLEITANGDGSYSLQDCGILYKGQFVGTAKNIVITATTGMMNAEAVSVEDIETITTLDGKRVDALQRGVNIVRMKNGNVCKVVRY